MHWKSQIRHIGWCAVLWILGITSASGQFYNPYVYLGADVGGGFSNMLNQNNYGFPKMGYIPAIVTRYGVYGGLAIRPWSRIQVGAHWQQAKYRFADSFASGSTEPSVDLRKQVHFDLFQVSLTYRQHLIPRDLAYVGTDKSIELALRRRHSFFLLLGPQLQFFRAAEVAYQKRNASTANTWQPADLKDIKPAFDSYVPVDQIPDNLPEDGRDLYRSFILSLMGGLGWQMNLSPDITACLEVTGSMSVNDFNADDRGPDGAYLWRRRVFSGIDPKAYFPSTILTLVLSAGLEYRF